MHLQKRIQYCFLLLATLVVGLPVFAQDASYATDIQYFTTADGLSHREVKCIFEDQQGMIWIGTRNGLNRFDGYSFKHWLDKNHGVDLRNLSNIGQDDEGWLWLQTNKTLLFFHPITETFQTIEERFGKDHFLGELKRSVSLHNFPTDDFGHIYINEKISNVMHRYHSSEGFITLKFPKKINTSNITVGKKDNELYHVSYGHEISESTYTTFLIDEIKKKEIIYKEEEGRKIFSFYKVNNEWYQWKIKSDQPPELYDHNQQHLLTLKETDIKHPTRCVQYGQESRIWIGTDFGFYMVSVKKNQFNFIKSPASTITRTPSARGIWADKNQMKACFEPQLGFTSYDFLTKEWKSLKRINTSRAIFPAKDGSFWIGGANQVLHWKDKKAQSYTLERILNGDTNGFDFWCFTPSRLDNNWLWIGTKPGLFKLNITKDATNRLVELKSVNESGLDIQHIEPDKDHPNWLWLCTNKGLWLFDEKQEKLLEKFDWNKEQENYLPSDNFHHLYQDNQGVYWLATANGVIRWDRKNNQYRQITIEDGLPNNVIYAIYPDDFGNLWMSSDYGIIKMNKETFAIENFLPKDGVGQTEFNRISHFEYRDKKGQQRLFFGGLNGVTTFYPKDFQKEKTANQPQLVLLSYQQFSGSKQTVINKTLDLKQSHKIVIKPNDYIVELEVGLLNYENVNNNQYLYQLKVKGNKTDWQVQKKRILQLGQLPYGHHTLSIKAKTISNTPAANELKFEIIIKKPFYLTWWFILLAITSLIGLGTYWYNRRTTEYKNRQTELEQMVTERTAQIQKQAEELQQLDTLKSRFFANVSHELRTPMTLILGPIRTILKRRKLGNYDFTLLSTAEQSGEKLLKLVGSILDLSKMESGKMELQEEEITLFSFTRRIISAFESHAQREGIQFRFEYKAEDDLQIVIDKNKLEIILNNLLSNAMKFTPKGETVSIEVKDIKNRIEIGVHDTGRGIHPDDLPNIFNRFYQSTQKNAATEGGTGIGLALSREFVQLMGGKIWVESELGVGSQFYISLPRKEVLGMVEQSILEEALIVKQSLKMPVNTTPFTQKTLLIVEDNHSLRDYLTTILSPHFHIQTASNGQVALNALSNNQKEKEGLPDLIISDIMMPVMDGYQLLTTLKSTAAFKNIPIIMLTARADIQDKLKALRIGVDDYLLKPFDEEELLTRIENLLANYDERKTYLQIEETSEEKDTSKPSISEEDQQWLEKLEKLVLENMTNSDLSNDYLSELLFISRKTLYRNIKRMTGLTPNKYIRTIRLQKAKQLLEQGNTVKVTAYKVGFQSTEYFSNLFKKEFGKLPSKHLTS